jgi:DNA (cytosine-5)-methyltransferase 1
MTQEKGSPCVPGKKRRGRAPKATAIDIFAGAGGFTIGAEQAGAHTLFAINHFAAAVETHSNNHPYTTHCHEDVFNFDWNRAPEPDIILASPSCKCHSTANVKKSDAPKADPLRATPWAVVNCLENQVDRGNFPIVVVENVTEFRDRWKLYRGWRNLFEGMGYSYSENVLCALDFGVPQRRTRLFVIFTPTEKPFDLKAPRSRHCPRSVHGLKKGDKLPFKPLIHRGPGFPPEDWIPLGTGAVGKKAVKKEARLKRRLGRVPPVWYWANTDTAPLSASEPCGTITAKSGNQLYLVKGKHMRQFSVHELRGAMGFPKDYVLPTSVTMAGTLLGNAVVPQISKFIVKQLIARA